MISHQNASRLLMGLLSLVVLFHILILVQIIPFHIAWGGRLETEQEMYVFESVSIALNVFLIWIIWLKSKNVERKIVDIILWIFFVLFSLNTIGNLFAHATIEKFFSIITLVFALLILRIILVARR